MSRGPLAIFVAVVALTLGAAVPAAGASPGAVAAKKKPAHHSCKKGRAWSKKAKKCVKKKKARSTKPVAPAADPPPQPGTGTPVTASVLDGSATTLDLGRGIVRTFNLRGAFTGYLQGAYMPGETTNMMLTRGTLAVAPTDVLTDDCPSPAVSRTNPATSVNLDPENPSPLVIGPDGVVKFTSHLIIRVVLDLRGSSPCGGPTTTSGYADTPGTVVVTGQVGPVGIGAFQLGSRAFPLPLRECWVPGDPAKACMGPASPLWSTGSTNLNVSLKIGG